MISARRIAVPIAVLASALAVSAAATAGPPGFVFPSGCCFYDGGTVRTVVPPAAFPNEGTDPFYAVLDGATGQKAVVGEAPGDPEYEGGRWAFHAVTWNSAPYLLTSEAAIIAAAAAGHVTITRIPANDFLCPIQP
jgi:hypothetical protein